MAIPPGNRISGLGLPLRAHGHGMLVLAIRLHLMYSSIAFFVHATPVEKKGRGKLLLTISDHRPLPPLLRQAYDFRRYHMVIDHHRYHFIDEGDPQNPPVLMLHGNPTWSFYYRRLITALKQDYRIIAPDHMGCGLSDKPQDYPYCLKTHMRNVKALVDHLQLKGITLVCHDWGGAIGMGVAARRPDLFSRFVVLNTAAWRSARMPKRIAACRIPLLGPLAVRGFNGFALAATRMAVAKPLDTGCPEGVALPLQQLEKPHCRAAVRAGHPHEALAPFL